MDRCISTCHNLSKRCEHCPNDESKLQRTARFDRVYIIICLVAAAVFALLLRWNSGLAVLSSVYVAVNVI